MYLSWPTAPGSWRALGAEAFWTEHGSVRALDFWATIGQHRGAAKRASGEDSQNHLVVGGNVPWTRFRASAAECRSKHVSVTSGEVAGSQRQQASQISRQLSGAGAKPSTKRGANWTRSGAGAVVDCDPKVGSLVVENSKIPSPPTGVTDGQGIESPGSNDCSCQWRAEQTVFNPGPRRQVVT